MLVLRQRWRKDDLPEILLVALDVLTDGLIQPLHVSRIDNDTRRENGLVSFGRLGLRIDHQEIDNELLFAMGDQCEIRVMATAGFVISCNLHFSFWQEMNTSIGSEDLGLL